MIRLVLDTNVLVSAFLMQTGNEAIMLKRLRDGTAIPCTSSAITDEYRRVLLRPKFSRYRADAEDLLNLMARQSENVTASSSGFQSPDPRDTPFIDCAVAAKADYLVTGNKRHFPEQFYGTTEVVNARQLLVRLFP